MEKKYTAEEIKELQKLRDILMDAYRSDMITPICGEEFTCDLYVRIKRIERLINNNHIL